MNETVSAEFTVYGHDIEEMKAAAKMIGRRFFGSLPFTYTIRCEHVAALDLFKGEVDAYWDQELHGTAPAA